ncbi:TetR/AcrR family transcriptional regulator [Gordonia sp. NPDC003425]
MARRRGWGGSLPADDDDAARRILDATLKLLHSTGELVSITDVTQELQITRQTVYRYYPSVEALLQAAANDIAERFSTYLVNSVRGITDPAEAVVEFTALTIEALHGDNAALALLATTRRTGVAAGITDDVSRDYAVSVLRLMDADWEKAGFDDATLDELAGWLLLVVDAFVSGNGRTPVLGPELRRYLATWLAPSIAALTQHVRGR